MPREAQLAVLFADVSGSTQLYDVLGDVRAREIVARCIAVMTEATERHGGTLVKTIGDEVMSTFSDATAAAEAACEMQEQISGRMVVQGRPLAIRVGFHVGSTLLEDGDVFGDAVNVASRMANQAKAGQILTTGATVTQLTGPRSRACRQIDLRRIQGKREEIAIYELVWQEEGATLVHAPWATRPRAGGRLTLTAGQRRVELGDTRPSLTIGRADQNDLVVHDPVVSRLHARIDYRDGRFVLTDLSANGTYVTMDDGARRYVHRDSLELRGGGTLGLGEAPVAESFVVVRYEHG